MSRAFLSFFHNFFRFLYHFSKQNVPLFKVFLLVIIISHNLDIFFQPLYVNILLIILLFSVLFLTVFLKLYARRNQVSLRRTLSVKSQREPDIFSSDSLCIFSLLIFYNTLYSM